MADDNIKYIGKDEHIYYKIILTLISIIGEMKYESQLLIHYVIEIN